MLEHAQWSPGLRGARVADLFAGTGALGIEALSRGAASAIFIEQASEALRALKTNLSATAAARSEALVLARDATRPGAAPPGYTPVSVIFLDPPYGLGLAQRALQALPQDWLVPDALAVVEDASDAGALAVPGWEAVETRRFGAATFQILRRSS
jgi:16S rRNA (guanine966-N2)-methyltransferase